MGLFALPDALIERILFICDVQTIANAAAVSRSLQRVASSESLWLRICQQQFTDTDPRQWHHAQETGRMHQTYRWNLLSFLCLLCLPWKALYIIHSIWQYVLGGVQVGIPPPFFA